MIEVSTGGVGPACAPGPPARPLARRGLQVTHGQWSTLVTRWVIAVPEVIGVVNVTDRRREAVVFLGPSLPFAEARPLLEANYLPPADRGAVHRVLSRDPRVIVLLDGVFHGSPSVWQRELLDAMDDGVVVIEAASMGALRAVELAPLGMIGCGQVFRWYRDAVIEGDDEVALLHGDTESGYRALSEPLVNIRATLATAAREGCVSDEQAGELVEYARAMHYPDRCYRRLLGSPVAAAWPSDVLATLTSFIATRRVDVKRADARIALRLSARILVAAPRRIAAVPYSAQGLRKPARVLQGTVPGPAGPVLATELLRRARADEPELIRALRAQVARRFFIGEWARQYGVCCPRAAIAAFARRWDRRHDLDADGAWSRASGLTPATYRRLLTERADASWVTERCDALLGVDERTDPPAQGGAEGRLVLAWALDNGVLTDPPGTAREVDVVCDWIVEQGPRHFGLFWHEDQALIEELQMTGAAARLAAATGGAVHTR